MRHPAQWKAIASHPPTLRRTWESLREVMAPGALDPLTKEMVYVAISSSNGCRYCVRSHTAAARKGGMSEQMLGELLAVVGMCNETNRLVQAYDGAVLPAVIALAATLLLIIIIIIIISLSLSACVEEEAALPLSVLSLSVLSLSPLSQRCGRQ